MTAMSFLRKKAAKTAKNSATNCALRGAAWSAAMSWVAELKAISQNTASVSWKNWGIGIDSATSASEAPISNCSVAIHQRLLRSMSTSGDHSGLMTQGRYSQLVYSAMSVLETSRFLYITTDSVITTTYGMPCAKYSVGTQRHGVM